MDPIEVLYECLYQCGNRLPDAEFALGSLMKLAGWGGALQGQCLVREGFKSPRGCPDAPCQGIYERMERLRAQHQGDRRERLRFESENPTVVSLASSPEDLGDQERFRGLAC